ncbi:MAG: 2-oxoglutarate dehydrogenase complex dihydrolipoyllysine-residue succinyltransferase [Candidatus Sumerlaeia bacterium]
MAIELKVPSVGESVTEVFIGAWRVGVGDSVQADDPLVEIESDKATVELSAPASGVVIEILKQKGETATVGEVIGRMEPGGAGATAAPHRPPEAGRETPPAAESGGMAPASSGARPETPAAEPAPADVSVRSDAQASPAMPAPAAPPAPRPAAAAGRREEEAVAMSPLRRRIAENLVAARHQAALLTTFNEVDMSAVLDLRRRFGEVFQQQHGVKLGLMSFFVKATISALELFPQLNAEIRGDHIIYKKYFDIGIAVSSAKGLVVPVLRNAEAMSFAQIEERIADFARRARDNRLTLDELKGGTFTISNGGVFGSLLSTPIVNPPQVGVLGMHAIQDRPVARDGQVVIRPMMYVALTYDHRIVDGREAVTFLRRIKECIEDPARLALGI